MEEFDAVFSDLLDSLTKTNTKDRAEIEDAITWFKEVQIIFCGGFLKQLLYNSFASKFKSSHKEYLAVYFVTYFGCVVI